MRKPIDVRELLVRQALFRNLDPAPIERLAKATRQIRLDKGGILFRRGEMSSGLHIVVTGSIKLAISAPSGQEKVIEFFGPDQVFGEAVMFLGIPYPVEAQALEDSLILLVDRKEIDAVMEGDPAVAKRMLASLSLKLHTLMRDIETVNLQNATQRVVAYLLNQPRENGRASFAVSKALIASKLGLTPETLSRILNQLSSSGAITVDGREVLIHNPTALHQTVFGDYSMEAAQACTVASVQMKSR